MIKIGLTGNAGSGKSTAIDFFQSEGIDVISTDEINSNCRRHGKFLAVLLEKILNTSLSDKNGLIDSEELRKIIFASRDSRRSIEILLHPLIMENVDLQLALLPENDYCFIEIPLLYEANLCAYVDTILLVTAEHEKLIERLNTRSMLTGPEAESVLQNQLTDNIKFTRSNDIVLNTDTQSIFKDCLERLLHRDS